MGRFLPFMAPWAGYAWGYPAAAPYAAPGATPPQFDEEQNLTDEAAYLEAELDRIRERLGQLKKAGESRKAKKDEK